MLQGEHSAILLTFLKLPFVIKIFVLSIYEWPFYTDFTVNVAKFQTLTSFLFSKNVGYQCWNSQMHVRIASREGPDQTDSQKQSDLGLSCLSRLLWQATTIQNFRTFNMPIV